MSNKPPKIAPVDIDAETQESPNTEAVETTAVSRSSGGLALTGEVVSGEVQASDIIFPTVKIIQKMSNNPDKLDLGTITLNETLILGAPSQRVNLMILSFEKYYKEVIPFGQGMPQMFSSLDEVTAAGFKLAMSKADRESGDPIVDEAVRALVAFEQPEGRMDRSFPLKAGEVRFAPARWYIESSAYRAVAKVVFSKMAFELRSSEAKKRAKWILSTQIISGTKGEYAVPQFALANEEYEEGTFETLANILQG